MPNILEQLANGLLNYSRSEPEGLLARGMRQPAGLLGRGLNVIDRSMQITPSGENPQGLLGMQYRMNNPSVFDTQDERRALGAAYGQALLTGPLGMAPLGATLWHGSNKKFAQFDPEKIGTNRGLEQGWGAYTSDAKTVAGANGEHLYKVDVPDSVVENALKWQTPLKDQPRAVRDGVLKTIGPNQYRDAIKYGATGSDVYNTFLASLSQREASELLARNGIPAIRYAGNGTENTVLLNPSRASFAAAD